MLKDSMVLACAAVPEVYGTVITGGSDYTAIRAECSSPSYLSARVNGMQVLAVN